MDKYKNTPAQLKDAYKYKSMRVRTDEIISSVIKHYKGGDILDVGEPNLLSSELEEKLNVKIDHTEGDLDFIFYSPKLNYDLIIFSHVIEHLMNPLGCLTSLKERLTDNGKLIIAYPIKFKKGRHHFHEIPLEDMKNLISKAGLKILDIEEHKVKNNFNLGIRPIIKRIISYFFDRNYIIVCEKRNETKRKIFFL